MKTLLNYMAIAAVLSTCCSFSNAQSVTNGSFEPTAPGQFVNGGDDKMIFTAAPGWTINTGSPDWMYGPGVSLWDTNWDEYFQLGGGIGAAGGIGSSLPSNVVLSPREGVGQTVSGFTPGNTYTISFSHTNGFIETPLYPPGPGGWELYIDNTSVMLAPSINVIGSVFPLPHTTDWQTSSYTFVATSNTHKFDFMSYGPGIGSGQNFAVQWLDNVQITPVPEPASLGLLGLGAMALIRRRKSMR